MRMQEQMQKAYAAARAQSFGMSQAALASRWSPGIRDRLLQGWNEASPGERRYRVQVGDLREREAQTILAARTFNAKVATTAPELRIGDVVDGQINFDRFLAGTDEFGLPIYNVDAIQEELALKQAQYDAEKAQVDEIDAEGDKLIASQEEARKNEITTLQKQLANVQDNLRQLANARESKAEDQIQAMIAGFVAQSRGIDPQLAAAATSSATDEASKRARDEARNSLFTSAANEWKKQEAELLQKLTDRNLEQPRAKLVQQIRKVQEVSSSLTKLEDAVKKGAKIRMPDGSEVVATPQMLEAARKNAEKTYREFDDSFGRVGAHRAYNGSYKVRSRNSR